MMASGRVRETIVALTGSARDQQDRILGGKTKSKSIALLCLIVPQENAMVARVVASAAHSREPGCRFMVLSTTSRPHIQAGRAGSLQNGIERR